MASSAVSSFHFNTDDFPEEDRFEMWREVISATHDVALLETESSPFHINYDLWQLGQLAVSSGSFSAQSFARPDETIKQDQIDHFGLFVQGKGARDFRTGSAEDRLGEYDIQITDFAQAEISLASAGNSGTLYLARDVAEEILPNISSFHGTVLRDSMATLLAQHILGMGAHLPHLPVTALPNLTQATMEMAVACLQSLASGSWEMNSAVLFAMRRRVERYIEFQLEEPDMMPTSVARACDMSRSTLYRLFKPHGGVMVYVKRRRLHRIRSILVANGDARSLADISEDYGFQSGAHFSREFRKEFGSSPGDVRGDRLSSFDSDAMPEASLDVLLRSIR